MKKTKFITWIAIVIFFTTILTGCLNLDEEKEVISPDNGKLLIVATLFPQYDFARQIAGDKAEVIMLLPPGVDSHSYEPAPSDIIRVNSSDLFIYTGEYMETWAHSIIEGIDETKLVVLDVSKGIDLVTISDMEDKLEGDRHKHGDELENDNLYDPHIWTSPIIAKKMVNNILESLCQIDPDNTDFYELNAKKYLSELDQLDSEFRSIVESGARDEIIFGSKFALYYFAKEYALNYDAAFDTCSTETEPSARTIARLIDEIKWNNIPVIYYAELTEPLVAKSISEETGAKMLLFHSCHNVSRDEFKSGVTYLSLMEQNAKNLKEGLN